MFAFQDARGAEHVVHSDTGSAPPSYAVGDGVVVLFDPRNPAHAAIDNFWSLWLVPLVTGILGAAYLPIGLAIWHWPKLKKRTCRMAER